MIPTHNTSAEGWDNPDRNMMQAQLYSGAYYVHYGREPKFKFLVMPRLFGTDEIQEWEIPFDPDKIQRYIDGVVRRKVDMVEAGIFPAKPSSRSCNEKYCAWWWKCAFGGGTDLK
jgi:hypothetical protein